MAAADPEITDAPTAAARASLTAAALTVTPNRTYPYTTLVYVTAHFANVGWFSGSGVMIDGNDVLTAAHLVYSADYGVADEVDVAPAAQGTDLPYGTLRAGRFEYNPINDHGGAEDRASAQNDLAVVGLSQALGAKTGTMALKPDFSGGTVNLTGYPVSSGTAVQVTQSGTVTPNLLFNTLDYGSVTASAGASGGPLWVQDAAGPAVVGVVATDSFAAQLTAASVAQIQSWEVQNKDLIGQGVPDATGFDRSFYLANNPDVAGAGVDPYAHYQAFGWREGRDPNALFNDRYYLANNPDVRAAGVNPLTHYIAFGWREGREPSATFDAVRYLADNPDVKAAGINPVIHYLTYGVREKRVI